jgi:glucose-6-phosphate 1-dehydrogenase
VNITNSDALIFFGATGDLAHKKIFPALQIVKRGTVNVPVIGVSRGGMPPRPSTDWQSSTGGAKAITTQAWTLRLPSAIRQAP